MKWCPRCFKVMSEKWAKKANYSENHKLNVKDMIFPCQVPIYEPGITGEPMIRIWDCVQNKSLLMGVEDYRKYVERKKNDPKWK